MNDRYALAGDDADEVKAAAEERQEMIANYSWPEEGVANFADPLLASQAASAASNRRQPAAVHPTSIPRLAMRSSVFSGMSFIAPHPGQT
jgi:hypothetical protein